MVNITVLSEPFSSSLLVIPFNGGTSNDSLILKERNGLACTPNCALYVGDLDATLAFA